MNKQSSDTNIWEENIEIQCDVERVLWGSSFSLLIHGTGPELGFAGGGGVWGVLGAVCVCVRVCVCGLVGGDPG